jgi:hypothetical protein
LIEQSINISRFAQRFKIAQHTSLAAEHARAAEAAGGDPCDPG